VALVLVDLIQLEQAGQPGLAQGVGHLLGIFLQHMRLALVKQTFGNT
jgi:hypothetical protein